MLIEIKNLSKAYGKVAALNNVNIRVEKGEVVGIIGLSGAGKSTLIRCINRLEKATSGEVLIKGRNIQNLTRKELRDERKKIGMIFQHFNLLHSRTVFGNILFPMEIANVKREERMTRAEQLLELVELSDKKDMYPSQLSGGQKQRVGIARALANEPDVLLCDEATSALDPKTTKSILKLLKQINERLGLTIILITHEMDVIREICGRVEVIENGQIIESGNTIDVFTSPKHPTTKSFLQVAPHPFPTELYETGAGKRLLRLNFKGTKTKEPVFSSMIKKFDVDASILQGNMDNVQGVVTGNLIVELSGQDSATQSAIAYLETNGVTCEVIA